VPISGHWHERKFASVQNRMPTLFSLQTLFLEAVRELQTTESRLLCALPVLARAATSRELKAVFKSHLALARMQAARLEWIFGELAGPPVGGIRPIEAGEATVQGEGRPLAASLAVEDLGLIAAAQHIEHHAVGIYGRALTYARLLGLDRAGELLQVSLHEAAHAVVRLAEIGRAPPRDPPRLG